MEHRPDARHHDRLTGVARTLAVATVLAAGACGPPTRTGTVLLDGGRTLAYEVIGSGVDTVLVLHGGPAASHRYLADGLRPLAGRHTLIFYDMRGRGASSPVTDSTEATMANDIADVDRVRAHFRLSRVTLIGHQWGGAVAARYARQSPERVTRLALLSPWATGPGFAYAFAHLDEDTARRTSEARAEQAIRTAEDAQAFCRAHWAGQFAPFRPDTAIAAVAVAGALCDEPGERLLAGSILSRWLRRSLGAWDWTAEAGAITAPMLVIEAAEPGVVRDASKRWAQYAPAGRLLEVGRPYGMPWLGDRAGVIRALDEFLAGGWPSGASAPPRLLAPAPPTPATNVSRSGGGP